MGEFLCTKRGRRILPILDMHKLLCSYREQISDSESPLTETIIFTENGANPTKRIMIFTWTTLLNKEKSRNAALLSHTFVHLCLQRLSTVSG